jgi:hypothetical protein
MDQLTGAADTGELMAREAQLESRARQSAKERNYGLILVDLVGLTALGSRRPAINEEGAWPLKCGRRRVERGAVSLAHEPAARALTSGEVHGQGTRGCVDRFNFFEESLDATSKLL